MRTADGSDSDCTTRRARSRSTPTLGDWARATPTPRASETVRQPGEHAIRPLIGLPRSRAFEPTGAAVDIGGLGLCADDRCGLGEEPRGYARRRRGEPFRVGVEQ